MKFNEKNVMIDLETLSTAPNALILSIGLVDFDITKGGINNDAHIRIRYEDKAAAEDFDIDPDTVLWWFQQSDQAREALLVDPECLHDALISIEEFIPKDADVWGNGSDFDNVILANAYRSYGYPSPWHFSQNRCFRTVKNLFPEVKHTSVTGVEHNALDDAINQAAHLFKIYKHIKGA